LFVYPDFQETVGGTQQHGSYSEGLASLSAVLKEAGQEVALYHLTRHPKKENYIDRIRKESPNLIAFAARTSIFPYVQEYAGWTNEALPNRADDGVLTICGSYHPTLEPQETIDTPGIDIACLGEGEGALVDLCTRLDEGKSIGNIRNLWLKTKTGVVRNPARPLIEDLDSLPLPDFDLFDYKNLASSRIKTATVMLSRGCPYKCTYCCNHQLREIYPNKGKYSRFRSPENSIEYLKKIKTDYPYIKYLNFMDNILPMRKKWFYDFIERYKSEIDLAFSCRFRADLMNREVVQALKDAGCYLVHFGVESGDDHIRNEILARNMKREKIKEAFNVCRELGISALSYNMINLPYEDMGKILETIKLNAELKPDRVVDTIFYPYPNTKLYQIALEEGFMKPYYDYRQEIILRQPTLSEAEVLFAQRYFRTYIRLYRWTDRLPRFLKKRIESIVDKTFVSRWMPHSFMVSVANLRLRLVIGAKRLLMKRAPRLYLRLRDKIVQKSN